MSNPLSILITEHKDDAMSKSIAIFLCIFGILLTVFFFLSNSNMNTNVSTSLSISGFLLIFVLMVIYLESKDESSTLFGAALFGSYEKLIIGAIAGLIGMMLLSVFLGNLLCSEQSNILKNLLSVDTDRYIQEGYCIQQTPSSFVFVLPPADITFNQANLQNFYIVGYAPFTEELAFRVVLFYSLLALSYGVFGKKTLHSGFNPLITFAVILIITNLTFGFFHYYAAQATCTGTELQKSMCSLDKIAVTEIFGFFWQGANLIFGLGFSLAAHAYNNALAMGISQIDFVFYYLIPLLGFATAIRYLRGRA